MYSSDLIIEIDVLKIFNWILYANYDFTCYLRKGSMV